MGGIASILEPVLETVAAIAVPELAVPIAAANFGQNVASGNPLGALVSGLGAVGAGLDQFGSGIENVSGAANGVDNISGNAVDNISGAAGGGIDPLSGVQAGTSNIAGVGGVDNIAGVSSGIGGTGIGGGGNNISGTGSSNNISGTSGGNNPAGLQKSGLGGQLKGASSAAGAAQNIAGLVNGVNVPTQANSGGTTFGTNISQGNTGGSSSVNQTGGFSDRQLYDTVDAIKARFASSGQSGSAAEQQAIQQALAGTVG